jgi:hypothetical protein
MGLIWQEFKSIAADAWDMLDLWAGLLRASIAENRHQIIVATIGLPISFALTGIPIWAALDGFGGWIKSMFGERPTPPLFGGSFVGFLLMFCVGVCVLFLTIELSDRIQKRLEGKSKGDDQPHPATPESEE